MIRTVSSSLPTFKAVSFSRGLNILLADVAQNSTARHTRNSAGKTSLVEIVHFLLGADASKKSLFKHEAIVAHSFSVEFWLCNRWIRATRSGSKDDIVRLSASDARALEIPFPPSLFPLDEEVTVSLENWKAALGAQWFKLPREKLGTQFDSKGAPSFRSLIGYFGRRRKVGGLDTIEKTNSDVQPGVWQVAISYLIGLDWHLARQFQEIRDRKRVLDALTKAIKGGDLGEIFGTTAEIRPELARIEEQVSSARTQVNAFLVHDSYRDLAAQAASLKDDISEITFALAEANSAVEYMGRSLQYEAPPAYADLERLYAAAGVELPTIALRRFDDVKAFQLSVAANRRLYLEEQISEVNRTRVYLESELKATAAKRTSILQSLDGKGAFEDLIRLREKLGELVSRAETLRSRLQHASMLEGDKTKLKAEAADLELKLQLSFSLSELAIKRATVLVDRGINTLYDDRKGNFIVEASRTGPKFRIDIQGGGNKGGIDMMKIFCFDTAVLQIACDRFEEAPKLLIHDSHLFDGVDSRQVGRALNYGQAVSDEIDGQYIVSLNSDELDKASAATGTLFDRFINPVRLADDEHGGLFGFRFDLE